MYFFLNLRVGKTEGAAGYSRVRRNTVVYFLQSRSTKERSQSLPQGLCQFMELLANIFESITLMNLVIKDAVCNMLMDVIIPGAVDKI